ncbi:MAG: radical SAM protein [Deltaproteobacteria bacterium]|nr:radical SAM protein [Deltaproteobacteria bacterium]
MGALLHPTTSLCRTCKRALPALVEAREDRSVWLSKSCPEHGAQSVRLSTDAAWYAATRAVKPVASAPRRTPRPVHFGCPFDCGACAQHGQKVRLPVVTITSACNLDCPICYVYNKNDGTWHMDVAAFRRILQHLKDDLGEVDIVNFTGGEPFLHPEFMTFLEVARDAGVHRVTICSNGLFLAKNEPLVKRLGELGARVALSFDTFDPQTDVVLQGSRLVEAKLRALDLTEKYNVDVTLIPVMTKGMNDHEVGAILRMAMERPNVRHVELHTITYTGQGGTHFDPSRSGRISMVEVLDRIAETTHGWLTREDFVSSPCAHPLCYQIAYLLLDPDGGPPVPFTRFMPREALYACLAERLYLEPSRALEDALQDAMDRLWVSDEPEAERTLKILRQLLGALFPRDRVITREEALRAAERASKAVYVHSHMDEDTFDVERLAQCCDSNCAEDGTTIPVCAYNVLYKEKEAEFMAAPRSWGERSGDVKLRRLAVLA